MKRNKRKASKNCFDVGGLTDPIKSAYTGNLFTGLSNMAKEQRGTDTGLVNVPTSKSNPPSSSGGGNNFMSSLSSVGGVAGNAVQSINLYNDALNPPDVNSLYNPVTSTTKEGMLGEAYDFRNGADAGRFG